MAHTYENTTGFIALTATATAIGLGVRVKLDSSGNISAAGATDDWIGTTISAIAASGTGTVRLRNSPGTHMFVAAGAIEVGDRLYPSASGKVDDVQSAGGWTGFVAASAALADGDIFTATPALGVGGGGNTGILTIPIVLSTVTAGDVATAIPLSFSGTITSVNFLVTTAVTTGSKAATLNLEIGTTNLTGGAVALTSANCTPLGVMVAGTAVTAANTFVSGDTLSIEGSSVTAFSEGAGLLLITYVNN